MFSRRNLTLTFLVIAASLVGGCNKAGSPASQVSVEDRIKTAPPEQAERMRRDMGAAERMGRATEQRIKSFQNMPAAPGGKQ